ncbi:MAG: NAAT family transporter [Nitrosomonas sp.]|uniref:MarC family protein n=1 Tax=Nitrosomonas sp. TaxID=42353 RepID=UPI0025EB2436|nr:NAAT family transporter [Nitrosomonas sp.]MBY0474518.1 NAAT family transporter [Nitrosomonas sp.]
MDWNEYTRMFVGLFAIVSPISVVPLYLSFTENIKHRRQAVARTTAFSVACIFIVTMLLGQSILAFFSISVDAFRVAGGILLMSIAFGMLQVKNNRTGHTPEEDQEAVDSASVAVVPLAMPLLAGPGSMSTVILFSNQTEGTIDQLAFFIICLLVALIIWGILHFAPQIGDRMSQTAMNVTTRVMGLMLAAMSVEFIVGGLRNLLPGLA